MTIWEIIALAKAGNGSAKSMLHFKGSVLTESALPETGNDGDTYLVDSADSYFAWDGEGWTDVGQLLSMDDVAALFDQVEDAGDAQVARIVAKGQEVEESIPEDYSELSGDVGALKSAFNGMFPLITWENGYYTNRTGKLTEYANGQYSSFIPVGNDSVYFILHFEVTAFVNMKICYFDDKLNFLDYQDITDSGAFTNVSGDTIPVENAKFVRLSARINTTPNVVFKTFTLKTLSNLPVSLLRGEHDSRTNYINFNTCKENTRVDEDGTIKTQDGYYSTDYIELTEETTYYRNKILHTYYAYYDSEYNFIASYATLGDIGTSFVIPSNAKYGRFSFMATNYGLMATYIFTQPETPESWKYIVSDLQIDTAENQNPCDYNGNEITVFNKCLCVGDSLTAGTFNYVEGGINKYITDAKYSYPTYLHKMTGIDVVNLGHGGYTSVQWYNAEENNNLSGYDVAIIQLGMNDALQYETFGTTTQTALSAIISKLQNENNNIKIFIANIIPSTTTVYSSAAVKQFSSDMLSWLISTYTNDSNVIPVDIQQYGHTGDSTAYNCGHLSALGYERLAQDYIAFISDYISKNKALFRQVQFIGTDKVWS